MGRSVCRDIGGRLATLRNRRLDQATFQALQALIARGQLQVSERLALAIRKRREALDISAKDLAERCGIEAMEIRDIENGACAISAPMLVQLSQALEVDLVWFLEQEPMLFSSATAGSALDVKLLDAKEGLALIHAFASIKDPSTRKVVLELAQRFAAAGDPDYDPTDKP